MVEISKITIRPRIDSSWRSGRRYRHGAPYQSCRAADAHYLGRLGLDNYGRRVAEHKILISMARAGKADAVAKLQALSVRLKEIWPVINVVAEVANIDPNFVEVIAEKYCDKNEVSALSLDDAVRFTEIIVVSKAYQLERKGQAAYELLGKSFRSLKFTLDKLSPFNPEDGLALLELAKITVSADENLSLDEAIEAIEIELIEQAFTQADEDKTKAAELLGIPFRSMRYKLSKYGIRKQT